MFDFDDLPEVSAAEHEEDVAKAHKLQRAVVTSSGLKAAVCRRPPSMSKAPISVLMLPGNPAIGGFHAELPLPLAVDESLCSQGFPVVRFDWNGVGTNSGTQRPTEDERVTYKDSWKMFEIAKALGERVCICSWNYSGTQAAGMCIPQHPYFLPETCALMSLSFGYKQWEFVQRFVNEAVGKELKVAFEAHSLLEVPTLYVFGSKDVHTPKSDVEQIVNARKDEGKGATIHMIDQSDQELHGPEYFAMCDREQEAGNACASWLRGVRRRILDGGA